MKKILIIIGLSVAACVAMSAGNTRGDASRNIKIFNNIFRELQAGYVDTFDIDAVTRTAIDAMLAQIDPYTEYFSPEELDELTTISEGSYSGIGSYIGQQNGRVYFSEPVWGSPSRLAGIRHGDVILSIDGVAVDSGTPTDVVSRKLRGPKGTMVSIKVRRPWVEDSILTFDIRRDDIKVNPVPYYGVDSAGVGYIKLTTFNNNSTEAVGRALTEMKANPALRGVILDLRDNGGGLLESAVEIVGHFVPKGTEVVRTRGADPTSQKIYRTTRKPIDTEIPVVVMINENSASSSEVVAGALQDLDRAVIVGMRSYGKGLVQNTRPIVGGGMLKVTVARYYIPSGRLIQAYTYSHRRDDNSPMRIPDSLTRVWHTAAGREVRDGGGITPEVLVSDTTMNSLLYSLHTDNWINDYANHFRAHHDSISLQWQVTDSLFNDFKAFIDPERLKYDMRVEYGIKFLRQAAEVEGYMNDSVSAQLDLLAGMLRHNLDHDLEFNRAHITKWLDIYINQRYFDDSRVEEVSLRYDLEADTARAVLLDTPRYTRLLSPAK